MFIPGKTVIQLALAALNEENDSFHLMKMIKTFKVHI